VPIYIESNGVAFSANLAAHHEYLVYAQKGKNVSDVTLGAAVRQAAPARGMVGR